MLSKTGNAVATRGLAPMRAARESRVRNSWVAGVCSVGPGSLQCAVRVNREIEIARFLPIDSNGYADLTFGDRRDGHHGGLVLGLLWAGNGIQVSVVCRVADWR
jgi:hypothetical protein